MPEYLGSYTYRRLMLHFTVDAAALADRLPQPWRPLEAGGLGNLTLSFIQILTTEGSDGSPLPAIPRYLAYNGTAHDPGTARRMNFWYRAYATDPGGLLGWSRATAGRPLTALIDLSYRHEESAGQSQVTQFWKVDSGGRIVKAEIVYTPGPLKRVRWEPTLSSVHEPGFLLHDVNDELRDTLKQLDQGLDRIHRFRLEVLDPEWSRLFEGPVELLGATAVPWAHRRVFIPDASVPPTLQPPSHSRSTEE